MQYHWQIIVTLLIVGGCAFYLLRNILGIFAPTNGKASTGCGSCSQSTAVSKARITPLVHLDSKAEEHSKKTEDQQTHIQH